MPLTPGTTLGPYSVTAKIGEGSMGEVYQARDTKLDRDVALKVLPEAFTSDPDRLARFEREAKVLASLNHPNIGSIYGLEEAAGVKAIVLELVEGPTLADRISKGPIPVDEALPIAKQIAEALEVAHEAGVIHRDLKPANLKLKSDGTVKVLDFGLAKAMQQQPDADPSESPTMTVAPTTAGVILGTAAYMAPEQARGKRVDKRADVWAFGAVLYEMLTGRAVFARATPQDTIVAVLEKAPDWSVVPEEVPWSASRLLRRCLEKNPQRRLRDMGDALFELGAEPEQRDAVSKPRTDRPFSSRPVVLVPLAGSIAVVSRLVAWSLRPAPPVASASVTRTTVSVPLTDRLSAPTAAIGTRVALSRDGTTLAYVASREAIDQILVRYLDQLDGRALPGTEGTTEVFFSPDGASVGFIAGNVLKRIPLSGGATVTLHELESAAHGASWGPDDSIVFGRHNSSIWWIPGVGGTPTPVTSLAPDDVDHANPHVLPGGAALVFRVQTVTGESNYIAVQDLATGERKRLVDGSRSWYLANGHLAYSLALGGPVWAAPFDLDELRFTRDAAPVLDDVARGWFAHAANGSAVYAPAPAVGTRELVRVDRQGQSTTIALPAGNYAFPVLSPDDSQLAVSTIDTIWVIDLLRGARHRLTRSGRDHLHPTWRRDGTAVTFAYRPAGAPAGLYSAPEDGGGEPELLFTSEDQPRSGSWSADGYVHAFYAVNADTQGDIWFLDTRRQEPPIAFVRIPANERAPRFSPDGRWLAYVSDKSGRDEIYVRPYPGPGQRVTISTEGGVEPVWSRRGGQLFYRTGTRMMVTRIEPGDGFMARMPQMLFNGPFDSDVSDANANYDVSLDGEQFVMVRAAEGNPSQLILVQSWFEELKRLVPVN